ncbi:MAG: phenylalanyl-tRNA synthetase alpha chain [Thermotogota bacterium]|nr:phenylalanyl-tRNA synthetase alpha chain [Thermotogota bacterium]MDK2864256.1 phenylalanyl-tRNA synthetase alpha chain [Thermotogota bacterium]HCZ05999.1 phenylalanine--tRNA ligase subunit alpha [Thermotogota bacterium]
MEDLSRMLEELKEALENCNSLQELHEVRVRFLGKKGRITSLMKQISSLPPEERPSFGKRVNELRASAETLIKEANERISKFEAERKLREKAIDPTFPGPRRALGSEHPSLKVIREILEALVSMGFEVVEGPEVETVYYNFEALNTPEWHPARDMQDTFYIHGEDILLRSHTSPVQVRVMEKRKPPVMIVSPGRVYRRDYDATHLPMFHQIEGLYVDHHVSVAHLKWTLMELASRIFGEKKRIRMRPSFFPFTEPSFEVDVWFEGKGWFEILGAGMVHPNVLKNVGYDPEEWSGFAFGLGPDRVAMIKYGIGDIRSLVRNESSIYQVTKHL